MNKEEILAKSRQENKDKDLVAAKADSKAGNIALIVGAVYALIVYFIQMLSGNGFNYSLFSLFTLINAVINVYKGFVLKEQKYIFTSICWTIATLITCFLTFATMFSEV